MIVIDTLRVGLGLVMFQTFISYFFTGTPLWNYSGKYTNMAYYKHRIKAMPYSHRNLTEPELALYNGSDPSLPIYVLVGRKIYDVLASQLVYSPPLGRYSALLGHECSRMLVTGCLGKEDEYTDDLTGLQNAEPTVLQWQRYYEKKKEYWFVGWLIGSVGPEIITPCENLKWGAVKVV